MTDTGWGRWRVVKATPENWGLPKGWYLYHPVHGIDDSIRCQTKKLALELLREKRDDLGK